MDSINVINLWLLKGCDIRHTFVLKILSKVNVTLVTFDLISVWSLTKPYIYLSILMGVFGRTSFFICWANNDVNQACNVIDNTFITIFINWQ